MIELLVIGLFVWICSCVLVIALCVTAARADRQQLRGLRSVARGIERVHPRRRARPEECDGRPWNDERRDDPDVRPDNVEQLPGDHATDVERDAPA